MKVTKYPQSCLVLEKDGTCIIIDPGSLVSAKYKPSDLPKPDAILLTHEHMDHVDPELIHGLIAGTDVPVVGNQSTADTLSSVVTQVVHDGEKFELVGFQIETRELPHCRMTDGSDGPQNTGFVIDGTFFHPGDGDHIDDLTVETLAAPIAGPDISPRDVFAFIEQVQCHKVIPIHYDYFPNDPDFVANMAKQHFPEVEFVVLQNGQSTEV